MGPRPAGAEAGGGGGGEAPPVPSDCTSTASSGPASGPSSGFQGLENVIQEGRSLISHSAYSAAPVGAYCLYRKRLGDPDSAYQLVGKDTGPEAGVIRDGQRPFKSEDYVFRTDAVTAAGMVAGSNTVGARGAGSIANVDGWAQINQSCASCGSATVQTGALKAAAAGGGGAGPPVGQVAVYKRRLAFQPASGAEWVARVLTPQTPSEPGTYASANMTISDEHPATARGSGSVADVTDSGRPFINVELRAQADGELHLVLTDSNGSVTYEDPSNPGTPFDLRTFGVIDNTYLTVQPQAGGTYEVRFKTNMNPGDTDIVVDTGRAVPVGLTSGWLSLRAEVSNSRDGRARCPLRRGVRDQPAGRRGCRGGVRRHGAQHPGAERLRRPARGHRAHRADRDRVHRRRHHVHRGAPRHRARCATPDGTISQVLDISGSVNAPVFVDQGLLGFVLDPGFGGDDSTERLRLLLVHGETGHRA